MDRCSEHRLEFLKTAHGAFLIPQTILSFMCIMLSVPPTTAPGTESVNVPITLAFLFAISFYCFMSSAIHLGTSLSSTMTAKRLPQIYYYRYHLLMASFLCFLLGIFTVVIKSPDGGFYSYSAGLLTIVNGGLYFGGLISIFHTKISDFLCRKTEEDPDQISPQSIQATKTS